jgi:hypothetical protein
MLENNINYILRFYLTVQVVTSSNLIISIYLIKNKHKIVGLCKFSAQRVFT